MKKTIFFYLATFLINSMICLAFLMTVSAIPQSAVETNARESADYFMEHPLFEMCKGDLLNFKKDNYADCISTSIAYHLGEKGVYEAVICADYNDGGDENVNEAFYREMYDISSQTESYSRYWHGSAGIIRMLLLFTDIEGIRWIVAAAGILLNAGLVIALICTRHEEVGIIYVLSFIAVNGVFSLSCLEYAFIFCIVPITGLILVFYKKIRCEKYVGLLFLSAGMFTAFFDFLTAETLTLTIPLAMYYMMAVCDKSETINQAVSKNSSKVKAQWGVMIKSAASWLAGYGGMFLLKWLLAFLYLGKNAFYEAFEAVKERMGTDLGAATPVMEEGVSGIKGFGGILLRNLGCLYWGDSDLKVSTVWLITAIVVGVLFSFWFITGKEAVERFHYPLWIFMAAIPYIRYAIVFNHSFIHYFFTYRAQMVTVMVVLYIMYRTTWLSEWHEKRRRKE